MIRLFNVYLPALMLFLFVGILGCNCEALSITQHDIYLTTTSSSNSAQMSDLGAFGTTISRDGAYIGVCSYAYNDKQGKCTVFSESYPCNRDWGSTTDGGQYELTDRLGAAGDQFGVGGIEFSADGTQIVACSHRYNTDQGKCALFTSSSKHSRDWGNQFDILDLSNTEGSPDQLGYGRARFSSNESHLVACSYNYNSGDGKCIVFSESLPGSKDWGFALADQYVFTDQNGSSGSAARLGEGGARFSSDDKHLLACSHRFKNERGKCTVFSASAVGNRDWGATLSQQFALVDLRNEDGSNDRLGQFGATFSSDDANIVSCSYRNNWQRGKCIVFSESAYGAEDWGSTLELQISLTDTAAQGDDTLGYGGAFWSADDRHITACAFRDNNLQGKCIIFSESNLQAKDWGSTPDLQFSLVDTNNDVNSADKFGFGGLAISSGNDFVATCSPGYDSGEGKCSTYSIDGLAGATECILHGCTSSPCHNNGTCIDLSIHDFECICPTGASGSVCETDINECDSSPCSLNGTSGCFDLGLNFYECKCKTDYAGDFCERNLSPCTSSPCYEDGTSACEDVAVDVFACECDPNYVGDICNVQLATTIVLSFTVAEEFASEANVNDFAENLQADLLELYEGREIVIEAKESNETYVYLFNVAFVMADEDTVSVSNDEVEVPTPTALELVKVLEEAGYETVAAELEEDPIVNSDNNDDRQKTAFPVLIVVIAALSVAFLVAAVTIVVIYNKKTRGTKTFVDSNGQTYTFPI